MDLKPRAVNIATVLVLAGVVGYGLYDSARHESMPAPAEQRTPRAPTPEPVPGTATLRTALDRKEQFGDKTVRTYTNAVIAQKRHDKVRGPFLVVIPDSGINKGDWPANVPNLVVVKTDWDTYNRTAMGIVAELKGPMTLCDTPAFGKLPVINSPAYRGTGTFDLGKAGINGYFWHGECGKDCSPPKPDEKPPAPDPQYILNVDFLNGLYSEMLRCTS